MAWTEVNFGKYKGKRKTLPQIIFEDPDWFFFNYEKKLFRGNLAGEAEEIHQKACSIRVPQKGTEPVEVEYIINPQTHKFSHFNLVPISKPEHVGSSQTIRLSIIDLKIPWSIASYDKQGNERLISKVKFYLFGSPKYKMTQKRCAEFFDNDENFDL